RLVALEGQRVERGEARLDERHAAAGDDALVHSSLRVAHGILDAVLALLELDLRRRAGPDDGDAAGQLREALLELLAIVVGVRGVDLRTDLRDAAGDLLGVARALDDRGLVLRHDDLAGGAQEVDRGVLELE